MVNMFESIYIFKKFILVTYLFENTLDYVRDISKSKDVLKAKYCNLIGILNRVKQGNLSRNEIVSLYSQARRLVKMSYSAHHLFL